MKKKVLALFIMLSVLVTSIPASVSATTDLSALRQKWEYILTGGPGIIAASSTDTFIRDKIADIKGQASDDYSSLASLPTSVGLSPVSYADPNNVKGSNLSTIRKKLESVRNMAIARKYLMYSNDPNYQQTINNYKNVIITDLKKICDKYGTPDDPNNPNGLLVYHYPNDTDPNQKRPSYWYTRDITIPENIMDIAVLVYNDMTANDKLNLEGYINTVNRYIPSINETAANRLEEFQIKVLIGVLKDDPALITGSLSSLTSSDDPFSYSDGKFTYDQIVGHYDHRRDGFYRDGSFIQHGSIAYTGNYGMVFIQTLAKLVTLLDGTAVIDLNDPAAFPGITNVYEYIENSYEPVVYNGLVMDMVNGRAVARRYASDQYGRNIVYSIARIAKLCKDPAEKLKMNSWVKYIIQKESTINDNVFYNKAAYTVKSILDQIKNDSQITAWVPTNKHYEFNNMGRSLHLVSRTDPNNVKNEFAFGISKSSKWVSRYETINENSQGWFEGDGMTYLYYGSDFDQYNDGFWPTVDYERLPGTTVDHVTKVDPNDSRKLYSDAQNDFCGGVTFEDYGVSSMKLDNLHSQIKANKSWFMFDDEIVALGSGIQMPASGEPNQRNVETIIENRKVTTPYAVATPSLKVLYTNGTQETISDGTSKNLTGVKCAYIAANGTNTGYYFPDTSLNSFSVLRNTLSGRYSEIGDTPTDSDDYKTEKYITMFYKHGLAPSGDDSDPNTKYCYVVLPNKNLTETTSYATPSDLNNPNIRILSNNSDAQAVYDKSTNMSGYVFLKDQIYTVGEVTSHQKAIVMYRKTPTSMEISVSDPTMSCQSLGLMINKPTAGNYRLTSHDDFIGVDFNSLGYISNQVYVIANSTNSKGKTFKIRFDKV